MSYQSLDGNCYSNLKSEFSNRPKTRVPNTVYKRVHEYKEYWVRATRPAQLLPTFDAERVVPTMELPLDARRTAFGEGLHLLHCRHGGITGEGWTEDEDAIVLQRGSVMRMFTCSGRDGCHCSPAMALISSASIAPMVASAAGSSQAWFNILTR